MGYSFDVAGGIVRDADGAYIPRDSANTDFQSYCAWVAAGNITAPYVAPVVPLDTLKQQLCDAIDNLVASIVATWARFQAEYEARQAAAIAYKAGGYTGAVSIWISGYADAAGVSSQVAADTIISQSVQLNGALETFGVLRMRKYEIKAAGSEGAAQALYADITAKINAVAAQLN